MASKRTPSSSISFSCTRFSRITNFCASTYDRLRTMAVERTFIMIKPDGVKRGLQHVIAQIFAEKGLKLIGMKLMLVSKELAEKHYADLSERPFFGELVDYIISGPVVALAFEGETAVSVCRTLIGATNPQAAVPGTIRSKYALTVAENVIHGSDSVENGEKELALWFAVGEIMA